MANNLSKFCILISDFVSLNYGYQVDDRDLVRLIRFKNDRVLEM